MSNIDDLRQDVESLENEISQLENKCRQLRQDIKAKENSVTEINKNPIVEEFEHVFEKFPQLRDLLYNESESNVVADETIQDSENLKSQSKKNKDGFGNVQDEKDLEEHEWVLKNQKPLEHGMFDTSIADIIDTKSSFKNRQNDSNLNKLNKLKEQVLLENSYRILGVTFFPVLDPNELEFNADTQEMMPRREMLGIRIDIFNEFIKKFESPSYILLKRQLKAKIWSIFKHTIPNYIPLLKIFNDITLNGNCEGYEDIYLFSKEIYLLLYKESLRGQLMRQWEHMGLITKLKNNLRSSNVTFQIVRTNIKLSLILNDDQIVNVEVLKGIHDLNLQNQICIILLGSIQELENKLLQLQQQQQRHV